MKNITLKIVSIYIAFEFLVFAGMPSHLLQVFNAQSAQVEYIKEVSK